MSKNQKHEGTGELKKLATTAPVPEVVDALKQELYSLPVYSTLQQVASIRGDIQKGQEESTRLLKGETFEALKARIKELRSSLEIRLSKTKAAALNGELAEVRNAIWGTKWLADWLEERAIQKLHSDPNHARELEELEAAVKAAIRVQELRLSIEDKEKEAQALLVSINS